MLIHSLPLQLHHDLEDESLGVEFEVAFNREGTARIGERKEMGRGARSQDTMRGRALCIRRLARLRNLAGHGMMTIKRTTCRG
jgi:hypothetical protein